MNLSGFPILSIIIFLPLAAGLLILALPSTKKGWIKSLAVGGRCDRPGPGAAAVFQLRPGRCRLPVHREDALGAPAWYQLPRRCGWFQPADGAAGRAGGAVRFTGLVERGRPAARVLQFPDVPGDEHPGRVRLARPVPALFLLRDRGLPQVPDDRVVGLAQDAQLRRHEADHLSLRRLNDGALRRAGDLLQGRVSTPSICWRSSRLALRPSFSAGCSRSCSWVLPSWAASSPSIPGRRMVTWRPRPPSR